MNRAEFYSPSKVVDIASSATENIEFRGLSSAAFGIVRINTACDDPTELCKVKATAKMFENRELVFENVQLEAIKRLFSQRSLLGAIQINRARAMSVSLTNTHSASLTVGMNLVGYDEPQLNEIHAQYANKRVEYPRPEFLYATRTIPIYAKKERVSINIPESDTKLYRMAISSTGDSDLIVSFRVENKTIIPEMFVEQLNDQFKSNLITFPLLISNKVPFEMFVTNLSSTTAHEISLICEAYKVNSK